EAKNGGSVAGGQYVVPAQQVVTPAFQHRRKTRWLSRPSPPRQFRGHAGKIEDRAKDMIEYVDEDPWIREKFESELAKGGLTTLMPQDAYTVKSYNWHPTKG